MMMLFEQKGMMMRYSLAALVFIAVLSAFTFFKSPEPARAEGGVTIAVVDVQRVMNDAEAAKDILSQVKVRREKMEKDIKDIEDILKKDEQDLIKKRDSGQKEAFEKDRKAFEKKVMDARAKAQKIRVTAEQSFNKAVQTLKENMLQVISDMAAEKKYQLVITKQNVIIGDKSLEVTDDVLSRLNGKIKSIEVK